jgi:hypothetical protein
MKISNKIQLIIGTLLCTLSIYQAFILNYNHFYEFLLIGIYLILKIFVSEKNINKSIYIKLYIIGLILGIIGDLILGIYISELWYYTYSQIWEYILLYLLIYPFGGIVLIQSYFILKQRTKFKNNKVNLKLKTIKILNAIFIIITLILSIIIYLLDIRYIQLIHFGILSLVFFFTFTYYSEKKIKKSFLRDILENPKQVIVISSIVTYLNAIIHEYPNTIAKQWIYTNIPFQNITILDVPAILILCGWFILLYIPMASYYLFKTSK